MSTRKTTIEINEELLKRVRAALGTTTLKETVDEAFREVLRERARREEVEALSAMRGMDLDDDDIMAGAWKA
jgi:Arc/MetJ family transcription regulator